MNKELTLKLVKRFPILYQDFYSPMSQTCMCWGFDCSEGWFDIIWQLSLAIEEELGYSWLQERWFLLLKRFVKRWNNFIYKLSPVRRAEHKMEGTGKTGDPYRQVLVRAAEPTWDEAIVQFLFGKTQKIGKWEMSRIALKRLAITSSHTGFAVQQVKEKFGTLRYYCPGDDSVQKYVDLACRLSAHTCEDCGSGRKVKKRNVTGWIRTQCTKCAWEFRKKRRNRDR